MTREPDAILDEQAVLTTPDGLALLEEVAAIAEPGPAELARWRKAVGSEMVAATIRIANGRRRGSSKFERADRMWLDPIGLEQATAEIVARHKAQRFEGPIVVDLCSGIGGDCLAIASRRPVLAVDRDAGMGRRLRWNGEVYGVGERILAVRADAARFPLPDGAWVHIDPDRRAGDRSRSGRARGLSGYQPGPDVLHRLIRTASAVAIKLGPASDFAQHFNDPTFEIEIISLGGECKEATLWTGQAATCQRRATRLPEGVSWTNRDGDRRDDHRPIVTPDIDPTIREWVFDPDPSLIRAGLLDSFAEAHGLSRVASDIDYLTGSGRVESPFLAAFRVIEDLPLDLKRLKKIIAARGIGPLEIKVRGSGPRPEAIRSSLKPSGPSPASLLLFRGRACSRAILAHRDR
jgi:hypothetical protein